MEALAVPQKRGDRSGGGGDGEKWRDLIQNLKAG